MEGLKMTIEDPIMLLFALLEAIHIYSRLELFAVLYDVSLNFV
jgi:hypothetical protein